MSAENQVDEGCPLQNFFSLLLSDTTADPDEQIRPVFFKATQSSEETEDFLFGLFPDGAGIDDNEVGRADIDSFTIVQRDQGRCNLLGVIDVHLTADGLYVKIFHFHDLKHATVGTPALRRGLCLLSCN